MGLEKYSVLIDKIKLEENEINETKDFKQHLRESISQIYPHEKLKFIGSTETGTSRKGTQDIDALLVFQETPDEDMFRRRMHGKSRLEVDIISGDNKYGLFKAKGRVGSHKFTVTPIETPNGSFANVAEDAYFHPEFINERKFEGFEENAILLKEFFDVAGLYEKVRGIGCELLTLKYRSFERVLEELRATDHLVADFSRNSKKDDGRRIVIPYPLSGIDFIGKPVNDGEYSGVKNLAGRFLENSERFFVASQELRNSKFWKNRISKYGNNPAYNMPDITLQEMEINLLKRLLPTSESRILDVGCGNGYTTLSLAKSSKNKYIGIDLCSDAMGLAQRQVEELGINGLEFKCGSGLNLPFESQSMDYVLIKRMLTNLEPSRQMKTIEETRRVLKKNGKLILFDYFEEPYDKLDSFRKNIGLNPIPRPKHSYLMNESRVKEFSKQGFMNLEKIPFSSTYFLLTRAVYPKLSKNPGYDTALHKIASRLPSIGSFDVNRCYKMEAK